MRCISSAATIAAVVLAAMVATTATANVGVDMNGQSFVSNSDHFLMCGKCATTGSSAKFHKLNCAGSKTGNSSSYAWIDYDCSDSTCGTCTGAVNVTMGQMIKASYASWATYFESSFISTKYGTVAASFQCCPAVSVTTHHSSSTCSSTDGRKSYQPSGCTGSMGTKSWTGSYCTSNGQPPSHYHTTCTSDNALYTADACPSTGKCIASLPVTNDPCLKMSGVSIFGSITAECQMDGTQECLRVVDYDDYTTNMTGTAELSTLKCTSGAGTLATLAAAVVAVIAAAFSA